MARLSAEENVARYTAAKSERTKYEPDWRNASAYCMPRHYNSWTTEGPADTSSMTAARRIAFDSTGVKALPMYMAILERIATPHNMRYQQLQVDDPYLRKSLAVRNYFDQLNNRIFSYRYDPLAKFIQNSSEVYGSMGVYGTGPIYVGRRARRTKYDKPGFLYRACPMRDIFLLVNDEGDNDTAIRRFWLNVRQYRQKWPGEELPRCMATKVIGGKIPSDQDYFEFIHIVQPRNDYDPEALDSRRHPHVGSYIAVADKQYIGEEEGYRSNPYLTPRTLTEAGNPYAFSPAMQALASMGTASQIKKSALKQGQKAAEPTYLAHDDGVMNGPVDLRPNAINYGGVDKQGRKLITTLDTGNFQVSDKLLQDERQDINHIFFAHIFEIIMETREMTATQVMDRIQKESALLSPTMGRLQSEWIAPCTFREIDMLDEIGQLPEMPPELIEAGGAYKINYTSPMAKGIYAEEVSGFMRAVETSLQIVSATGDQSHLDHFNFDTAIPEMSDYMAVPARWMNDEKTKAAIAESRQASQQQAELLKNAAPIAGAMKTMQQMQE